MTVFLFSSTVCKRYIWYSVIKQRWTYTFAFS